MAWGIGKLHTTLKFFNPRKFKMFHSYRINSSLLVSNGLTRDVEIESYIGGKKKRVVTRANADTFCLYDFLIFFNNAKNRRVIKQDAYEYTWIDYQYLIQANPLLFLNNTKIKRHLEILKALNLIDIINDRGSIYFTIINTELIMINNQPVMNHNQEPVMNHNQEPVMNHNSIIINKDNNKYIYNNKLEKEKNIIKKEKDNFEVNKIKSNNEVIEIENNQNLDSSQALECKNNYEVIPTLECNENLALKAKNDVLEQEFNFFYSLYPRKIAKINAKQAFMNLRLGKHKNYKGIEISLDNILLSLSNFINQIGFNGTQMEFIPYPASWLNSSDFIETSLALDEDISILLPQDNQVCLNEIESMLKKMADTINEKFKENPEFQNMPEYKAIRREILTNCILKIKEICKQHNVCFYKYYGVYDEYKREHKRYKWYFEKSFGDWIKESI